MRKIIVCYFASVGSLLGLTLALNLNQIPAAVIMGALFAAFALWFTDIVRQMAHRGKHRANRSKRPREFYSIDIPLDEDTEEKPAGSVRPGSRPSVTYLEMKSYQEGGQINDLRREA